MTTYPETLQAEDRAPLPDCPAQDAECAPEIPQQDTATELDDAGTPAEETAPSIELFPQDQGTLTLDQRRTLVRLLGQRYLTPRSHPAEWQTLIEHEDLFRSRLHDLMLDLRLDTERGVAFKTQIVLEETPTPRLLKDRGYTREETLILFFLRQRLYKERGDGAEVVIVDADEILDHVATYRPESATDQAKDRQVTEKALERMIEAGILKKTADTARLAIQPVLETLMPLETLRALAHTLTSTVNSAPTRDGEAEQHLTQDEGASDD